MPVRRFGGVNDVIATSIGAANVTGAVTIAVLARIPSGAAATDTLAALHNSGGSGVGYDLYLGGLGEVHLYNTNGNSSAAGVTVGASEGWVLVVASKGTGAVRPRMHKYRFDTGAWLHADGEPTLADGASCTSGSVRFGLWGTSNEPLAGDLAAVAIFASALSDAAIENLAIASNLLAWLSAGPVGLWTFEQASTAIPVVDRTGNGADQTSISGTTVVLEQPPIPYSAGVAGHIIPRRADRGLIMR